jgi:hypothetical protein
MSSPGNNPLRIYDGTHTWEGGVDSSLPATLISGNQCAWAVNRIFRGGYNDTRPGFSQRQTGYIQATVQGAGTYYADDGAVFGVVAIGGRVFLTNLSVPGYLISEVTSVATGLTMDPTQPHVWFCQAERTLIVQDGINLPIFWNGVTARRSNGNTTTLLSHEVPVGTATTYTKGRVWVAQGNNYVGGDLVNSNLSLPDPRDSVLGFTENDYLNEGGSFSVPGIQGGITALGYSMNIDTSLGEGDLLVGTAEGIFAFEAPVDRTTWKNLQQPIQRFAVLGFGPVSQESLDTVNGDMFFRSNDSHIRSYVYARRDFTDRWGNTPLSRQISRAIDGEAEVWLYASSGVSWANRYLFTVQPQRDQTLGVYYLGLGSLDFFNVGGIGKVFNPAWDGVWTGVQVFQIVKATVAQVERCFLWVRNPSSNTVEFWEIEQGARQDYNGTANTDISWAFETRSYGFPGTNSTATDLKALSTADFWVDNVTGGITLQGYYKPSLSPTWTHWASYTFCATPTPCNPGPACTPPLFAKPAAFSRIAFQEPDPAVNSAQNTFQNWDYTFAIRVTGSGAIRFKELRVVAIQKPEDQYGDLSGSACISPDTTPCSTGCASVSACDVNDYQ